MPRPAGPPAPAGATRAPSWSSPASPALLPGQLAGLVDLRRQPWARGAYQADPQQNAKVAARAMGAALPPGGRVLADLGGFGFQWSADPTAAAHRWAARRRGKTSDAAIHTCYHRGATRDAPVWLGAHRADRAEHAVRPVQFPHNGVLPVADVARLYARRWDMGASRSCPG